MENLILGNIFCLFTVVTDTISTKKSTTKEILFFQSISQLLYGISSIILGGYSAAVQNAVTIARNFFASQEKEFHFAEVSLIVIGVVLGISINNLGLIGLLPIFANSQYSIIIYKYKKNNKLIKTSFALYMFCYVIFNLLILNIVGGLSSLLVFIITVNGLRKLD